MAGGFASSSDAPIIPMGKPNMYGYMIAFAAAMGGLLFGYEIGVVSQVLALPGFQLQFGQAARLANGTIYQVDTVYFI